MSLYAILKGTVPEKKQMATDTPLQSVVQSKFYPRKCHKSILLPMTQNKKE